MKMVGLTVGGLSIYTPRLFYACRVYCNRGR